MSPIPSVRQIIRLKRTKQASVLPLAQAALDMTNPENELKAPELLYAPTAPSDVGLAAGMGVGMPWLFGKMTRNPMSLGRSAAVGFGPTALPLTAVGDAANMFMGPLADPRYQLGMQGYWNSFGKGVQRNVKQLGESGREAKSRYGALGIPVQMFHGLMNPLTSSMYLGKNVFDLLQSKEGQDMALKAEAAVKCALGENS